MSLSPSRVSDAKLKLALASCAGLLLLTSCISDGPNKTGGAYLAANGILLQDPLHHIFLNDLPLDTFWTTDLESSHLGDSTFLIGNDGRFSSQARLFYNLTDTLLIDAMGTGKDSVGLRFGLGFYRWTVGMDSLKNSVKDVDSMTFLVKSWAFQDSNWSAKQRADSSFWYGMRFMQRQDTSALLPEVSALDTIRIGVKHGYDGGDSLQGLPLPGLRNVLGSHQNSKWLVYLEVTTLDSVRALLRLGGSVGATFSPNLLFGPAATNSFSAPKTHSRLQPSAVPGPLLQGINYRLRYGGPSDFILAGKNRGMHLILSRQTLIDSIAKALGGTFTPSNEKPFDISFYVPFARLSLPLDSVRSDGGFPIDLQMVSDIDSLLPVKDFPIEGAYPVRTVDLGNSFGLSIGDLYDPAKQTDSLEVTFDTLAAGMRMLLVTSTKDTASKDTVRLAPGQTREFQRAAIGLGNQTIAFSVTAMDSTALVTYHIDGHRIVDPNEFRDSTGALITDLNRKSARFVHTNATALTLRATRAVQRLLNRAESDGTIFPDFFIQPPARAAIDSAANVRIGYPVMAEIAPKLTGGKPTVNLELYLYPLKER
jgi:hypothetical protein